MKPKNNLRLYLTEKASSYYFFTSLSGFMIQYMWFSQTQTIDGRHLSSFHAHPSNDHTFLHSQ